MSYLTWTDTTPRKDLTAAGPMVDLNTAERPSELPATVLWNLSLNLAGLPAHISCDYFFSYQLPHYGGVVVYEISMLKIEQILNLDVEIWKSIWDRKQFGGEWIINMVIWLVLQAIIGHIYNFQDDCVLKENFPWIFHDLHGHGPRLLIKRNVWIAKALEATVLKMSTQRHLLPFQPNKWRIKAFPSPPGRGFVYVMCQQHLYKFLVS